MRICGQISSASPRGLQHTAHTHRRKMSSDNKKGKYVRPEVQAAFGAQVLGEPCKLWLLCDLVNCQLPTNRKHKTWTGCCLKYLSQEMTTDCPWQKGWEKRVNWRTHFSFIKQRLYFLVMPSLTIRDYERMACWTRREGSPAATASSPLWTPILGRACRYTSYLRNNYQYACRSLSLSGLTSLNW